MLLKAWLNVIAAILVLAASLYFSSALTVVTAVTVVSSVYLGVMIIYLLESFQNRE
jgi:uncharacterized membrane protein